MKALVLIPSRYGSTRFPGKPLAKINDLTMIELVYRGCIDIINKFPGSVVSIVTDNDKIEDCAKSFNGNVVRVDDDVPSGSERINLAYERFYKDQSFDLIINVQGDEPLITSNVLEQLINFHQASKFDVTTVVKKFPQTNSEFTDPNKVKAIYNQENGRCLYFTRASAPFNRNKNLGVDWYLHVGIYSFKPIALQGFCKLTESPHEKIECLEQLRLLDNGYSIGATQTELVLSGVDSPSDIEYVERILNERKK